MKRRFRLLLTLISITVFACCTRSHDPRLVDIDRLSDSIPSLAAEKFALIDREGLSEHDGFYYDLLRLKIADKTNVDISRDSLILYITDYFEDHGDKATYTQALYYGGRVYSERGDYPTALEFYQKAIDNFPTGPEYLERKSNLLGQTSSLYLLLHIYTKGIQYATECVSVDMQMKDSARLADDMRVLGALYSNSGKPIEAEKKLKEALEYSRRYSPPDSVIIKATLAKLYLNRGDSVKALNTIRGLSEKSSYGHAFTLSLASGIYLANGIADSAYLYARKVIETGNPKYLRNAYYILLRPEIRHLVPKDSIDIYISRYDNLVDEYVDKNDAESFIIQDSRYNYQLHQKQREAAERNSERLSLWLFGAVAIILACVIVILTMTIRSKNRVIQLRSALDSLRIANEILEKNQKKSQKNNGGDDINTGENTVAEDSAENQAVREDERICTEDNDIASCSDEIRSDVTEADSDVEIIKRRIEAEIQDLKDRIRETPGVPDSIRESEIGIRVKEMANRKEYLSDKSPLWREIEEIVLRHFPDFQNKLTLFAGYKVRDLELRVYYLIKLGLNSSQAAGLLNMKRSNVSYYRNKLNKVFSGVLNENITLDEIIRHL